MHLYIECTLLEIKQSYSCHLLLSMNQNVVPQLQTFQHLCTCIYCNLETGISSIEFSSPADNPLYVMTNLRFKKKLSLHITLCIVISLKATYQLCDYRWTSTVLSTQKATFIKGFLPTPPPTPATSGSSLQTRIQNIFPLSHFQIQILLT